MSRDSQRLGWFESRSGFTLIELLVVIGIILVLAGLLFPAFNGAREIAKKAKAKTDVKQLEIALKAVLADYRTWKDANLPGSSGGVTETSGIEVGPDLIQYLSGIHPNNVHKVLYMEFDGSSTNTAGYFTDPWGHVYHATWGNASINDPFSPSDKLYRNAAAWSEGGKDGKPIMSWR